MPKKIQKDLEGKSHEVTETEEEKTYVKLTAQYFKMRISEEKLSKLRESTDKTKLFKTIKRSMRLAKDNTIMPDNAFASDLEALRAYLGC